MHHLGEIKNLPDKKSGKKKISKNYILHQLVKSKQTPVKKFRQKIYNTPYTIWEKSKFSLIKNQANTGRKIISLTNCWNHQKNTPFLCKKKNGNQLIILYTPILLRGIPKNTFLRVRNSVGYGPRTEGGLSTGIAENFLQLRCLS